MKSVWGVIGLCLLSMSANASLLSRSGGLAYYDTVLQITWLADANLAKTTNYDADGLMNFAAAQAWIASLNAQGGGLGYLGANNWRLPTTGPLNGSTYMYERTFNGSTDDGMNASEQGTAYAGSTASEMAHLYYNTLDNKAPCTPSSVWPNCITQAGAGLSNAGPFSNIQLGNYWSGTEYVPNFSSYWLFKFDTGFQANSFTGATLSAWAVRTGDIAAVPAPPTVWLLGTGLAGLVGRRWLRRKISR